MVKGSKRKLKKGAALRSIKRQKEHLEELQEEQAEQAASQAILDKPNAQLFVLDGQQHGSGGSSGDATNNVTTIKAESEAAMQKKLEKLKKKKNQLSELDRQQIDKLVSKHSATELAAMAEAGRVSLQKRQAQNEKNQGILRKGRLHKDFRQAQNYDLWGAAGTAADDHSAPSKKGQQQQETSKTSSSNVPTHGIGSALAGISPAPTITKAKTTTSTIIAATSSKKNGAATAAVAAVAIAKVAGIAPPVVDTVHAAGQSYRPEPIAHSKLLQQAVDIELRRNHAERYLKTPISQGLSEETKAYMVMDSSSSSSDESSDEGEDEQEEGNDDKKVAAGRPAVVSRTDKLTRAQRNKKKRQRRAIKEEELLHKERKRMRHEFAQLPKFAKELKRQELREGEKRREMMALQEQKRSKMTTTEWATLMSQRHALSAPTLPVALPSELVVVQQKKEPPTSSSSSTITDKNTAAPATTSTSSSSTLRTLLPKGSLVSMTTDRMLLKYNGGIGKKQHERKRDKNQRKRRRLAVQNKGTSGADFVVLG